MNIENSEKKMSFFIDFLLGGSKGKFVYKANHYRRSYYYKNYKRNLQKIIEQYDKLDKNLKKDEDVIINLLKNDYDLDTSNKIIAELYRLLKEDENWRLSKNVCLVAAKYLYPCTDLYSIVPIEVKKYLEFYKALLESAITRFDSRFNIEQVINIFSYIIENKYLSEQEIESLVVFVIDIIFKDKNIHDYPVLDLYQILPFNLQNSKYIIDKIHERFNYATMYSYLPRDYILKYPYIGKIGIEESIVSDRQKFYNALPQTIKEDLDTILSYIEQIPFSDAESVLASLPKKQQSNPDIIIAIINKANAICFKIIRKLEQALLANNYSAKIDIWITIIEKYIENDKYNLLYFIHHLKKTKLQFFENKQFIEELLKKAIYSIECDDILLELEPYTKDIDTWINTMRYCRNKYLYIFQYIKKKMPQLFKDNCLLVEAMKIIGIEMTIEHKVVVREAEGHMEDYLIHATEAAVGTMWVEDRPEEYYLEQIYDEHRISEAVKLLKIASIKMRKSYLNDLQRRLPDLHKILVSHL